MFSQFEKLNPIVSVVGKELNKLKVTPASGVKFKSIKGCWDPTRNIQCDGITKDQAMKVSSLFENIHDCKIQDWTLAYDYVYSSTLLESGAGAGSRATVSSAGTRASNAQASFSTATPSTLSLASESDSKSSVAKKRRKVIGQHQNQLLDASSDTPSIDNKKHPLRLCTTVSFLGSKMVVEHIYRKRLSTCFISILGVAAAAANNTNGSGSSATASTFENSATTVPPVTSALLGISKTTPPATSKKEPDDSIGVYMFQETKINPKELQPIIENLESITCRLTKSYYFWPYVVDIDNCTKETRYCFRFDLVQSWAGKTKAEIEHKQLNERAVYKMSCECLNPSYYIEKKQQGQTNNTGFSSYVLPLISVFVKLLDPILSKTQDYFSIVYELKTLLVTPC